MKENSKVLPDSVKEVDSAIPTTTKTSTSSPIHCPYRQAALIQQALAPDKMRIAFLLGAGCPTSIRISDGNDKEPLIPDIKGLTAKVCGELKLLTEYKDNFDVVLKRLVESGLNDPNIEEILSHIRSLHDVVGNSNIDGLTKMMLAYLDKTICKLITNVVKVQLPSDNTPYHNLATWIGGIQRAHPVEIFTPNYDLLMEQALEDRRVPYFDGFVGSFKTFFDLTSMEQDSLPARWARLWKVHGSFNWWRTENGAVERRLEGKESDRQMIYPSHLKYDQSRRMPYLAMLDRLRSFLARGQAVLVTCGYSFADQHLNEIIVQGLSSNPTAICFGLLFGDKAESPEAVANARKQPNLSLLAADGAILGTIEGTWRSDAKLEHPQHGSATLTGEMASRTTAPAEQCKFLLGDFKSLGNFLALQLAQSDEEGIV